MSKERLTSIAIFSPKQLIHLSTKLHSVLQILCGDSRNLEIPLAATAMAAMEMAGASKSTTDDDDLLQLVQGLLGPTSPHEQHEEAATIEGLLFGGSDSSEQRVDWVNPRTETESSSSESAATAPATLSVASCTADGEAEAFEQQEGDPVTPTLRTDPMEQPSGTPSPRSRILSSSPVAHCKTTSWWAPHLKALFKEAGWTLEPEPLVTTKKAVLSACSGSCAEAEVLKATWQNFRSDKAKARLRLR